MEALINILRNEDQSIETKGFLTFGEFSCVTLELPDKQNQKGISCIPSGEYEWIKVGATAKIPYDHISILNVLNRSGICIHIGNYASLKKSDVEGCIIVGGAFADINQDGIADIIDSKSTFNKLMALLPDAGKLTIK